jgi:hypothetical protein
LASFSFDKPDWVGIRSRLRKKYSIRLADGRRQAPPALSNLPVARRAGACKIVRKNSLAFLNSSGVLFERYFPFFAIPRTWLFLVSGYSPFIGPPNLSHLVRRMFMVRRA